MQILITNLYGVWDAQSQFLGPHIAPHTNVTEIDMGLDLLWRAGVTPGKVTLGLGWVSHELSNHMHARRVDIAAVRQKFHTHRSFM